MMRAVLNLVLFVVMLLGLALLTGCATTTPQIVQVPVVQPCPAASHAPGRPSIAISRLQPGDGAATVVRSYVESVAELQAYSSNLETLLDACK